MKGKANRKSLAKGNFKNKTVSPKKKNYPRNIYMCIYIYIYIKTMYTSISLTVTRK